MRPSVNPPQKVEAGAAVPGLGYLKPGLKTTVVVDELRPFSSLISRNAKEVV